MLHNLSIKDLNGSDCEVEKYIKLKKGLQRKYKKTNLSDHRLNYLNFSQEAFFILKKKIINTSYF